MRPVPRQILTWLRDPAIATISTLVGILIAVFVLFWGDGIAKEEPNLSGGAASTTPAVASESPPSNEPATSPSSTTADPQTSNVAPTATTAATPPASRVTTTAREAPRQREPPASSNASRATITAAPNRCENLAVDLDSFEVITPPRVSSGLPGRDPELGVTGPCEVVPSIKVSSYVETVLISDQSGSAPSRDQCGNGLPLSRGQALVLPASGWTACFVTDGGRTAAVGTTELSSRLIELDVAIY